jgi:hypothetical protein
MEGVGERRERWAHRGGGSTCSGGAEVVRQCLEVVVGGGGFSMAGDDATVVLHLGERERKVRWGSNRWKEARASSSPRG